MRRVVLFEILRKIKSRPALFKKVKIFFFVGIVGFVFVGGIAIWVGISTLKYVAETANQVITSPSTQSQIQNAKNELKKLHFQPMNCWGEAQSLLAVQPWIEKPVFDNLRNLKVACLDSKPAFCEGVECSQMKQLINTSEGRTI